MFHVCDPRGTSVTLGSWSLFSRRWLGRLIGLGAATRPRETMRPTRCVPGLMRGSRARGGKGGGVGERGGDRARDRGRGEDGSAGLGQRFARARSRRFPGDAPRRDARGRGAGRESPDEGTNGSSPRRTRAIQGEGAPGPPTERGRTGRTSTSSSFADLMMATTEAAGDGAARAVPDDRDRERRRTRARLTVRAGSNDGRRERGLHPRPDPEAEAPASVPPRARANAAGAGAPIFRRAEHQQLTRTAR